MKTLRLIGMAVLAILVSVNFASCSNEEVEPNFSDSEKVTVNFDLTGHFLDIENTPLGRAAGGNHFYGIQVYTTTNTGDNLPYAFGTFTSLEGVTIDLIKSQKYKFEVTVVIDGAESFVPDADFSWSKDEYMGKITYNTSWKIHPNHTYFPEYLPFDRYYGILEEYSPTENGTVTIDTKRVSYGIKFIAENINNGYLTVEYEYNYSPNARNTVKLTSDNPTYEKIYTLPEYFENIFYNYNTYTYALPVTITWKQNDDDTGTPLGSYSITVKPNVKSTVKINVNSVGANSNGITIITDETDMIEEEYTIENGKLS